MKTRVFLLSWLTGATLLLVLPIATAEPVDCHVGLYRLSDATMVDIAPAGDGALRWRRLDGTTGLLTPKGKTNWISTQGWTGRVDGKVAKFSACSKGRLTFDGVQGSRVDLDIRETSFTSHGVTFAGRLVLPKSDAPVPLVVLVHGAEHESARDSNSLQRIFPAEAIGAFVYDKRGTGASGGSYSQDYQLLADDAVAAMQAAKLLAANRINRIGYQGGSQAGWVLPIAVNRAPVDFAIIGFGLAVNAVEEDQEQVEIEMREKGHSPAEIASALQVASAAETVIASGFTTGFRELDALRTLYKDAPWFKDLHGNYTYLILPQSEAELRASAAKFAWGTPFYYDPMPALLATTTPQLWVLGGEDYEAPSLETSYRIKSLIADRLPFTLAVYPGAEHGMTLFEMDPAGKERLSTRFAAGYFEMLRDYARFGVLKGTYGDAKVTQPRTPN